MVTIKIVLYLFLFLFFSFALLLPRESYASHCIGTYQRYSVACQAGWSCDINNICNPNPSLACQGVSGGSCCSGHLVCAGAGGAVGPSRSCVHLSDGTCGPNPNDTSACGLAYDGCSAAATPTPPGSTPGPTGPPGPSCNGSCMAPAANCGVYGMLSGSGTCNGAEICCTNQQTATCKFNIVPDPIRVTQGQTIRVRPRNINASGTIAGFDYGLTTQAARDSMFFSPTSKQAYCRWVPYHGDPNDMRYICTEPPSGWGTVGYAKRPTNGVLRNVVTVTCGVIDAQGTITRTADLEVLPLPSGGPPGSGGSAWWQVVNGDAITGGDLISRVPSSGGSTTIYNDDDAAITYTGGRNFYVGQSPPDYLFDFHYRDRPGPFASLTFSGTSVTYIYITSNNGATANVRIDGDLVDTISQQTSSTQHQQERTYNVLPGTHTITVSNSGPSGRRTYIDAFRVGAGPAGLSFILPPNLTGFPGVALYGNSYDFDADANSQGSPSTLGWLVNSLYNGRDYTGSYFLSNLSTAIKFNNLAAVVDGATLESGGEVSPDGFFWYKATGDLAINNATTLGGTRKVVVVVEGGNLTLNGNITVTNPGQGTFIALTSKNADGGAGGISIAPTVTTLNGIFLSDGPATTGAGSVQLNVLGSFAALGGVSLQRDLGAGNDLNPAEVFTYDPRLIMLLPPSLSVHRTVWKEIAP